MVCCRVTARLGLTLAAISSRYSPGWLSTASGMFPVPGLDGALTVEDEPFSLKTGRSKVMFCSLSRRPEGQRTSSTMARKGTVTGALGPVVSLT